MALNPQGSSILRLLEFAFQNSSVATVIPLSFLHFTIGAVYYEPILHAIIGNSRNSKFEKIILLISQEIQGFPDH